MESAFKEDHAVASLTLEAVIEILTAAYDQPFDPIKAIRTLSEEIRRGNP